MQGEQIKIQKTGICLSSYSTFSTALQILLYPTSFFYTTPLPPSLFSFMSCIIEAFFLGLSEYTVSVCIVLVVYNEEGGVCNTWQITWYKNSSGVKQFSEISRRPFQFWWTATQPFIYL